MSKDSGVSVGPGGGVRSFMPYVYLFIFLPSLEVRKYDVTEYQRLKLFQLET